MKGFNVNATARYSDYKRFDVQTPSTISQPKPPLIPPPKNPTNKCGF
jgi:hypothetical protein